jgi:hypothetical protein
MIGGADGPGGRTWETYPATRAMMSYESAVYDLGIASRKLWSPVHTTTREVDRKQRKLSKRSKFEERQAP